MKPIRLELEGFAGIASGKGKKSVVVDLEKLVPAEAKMVALVAPNGGGKTTIMDNLHPFRLMPSHASKLTPSGFSFYDHIVGGEGSKTLIWEHLGTRYMSVLRFRATAKTKKTEAYLYVVGEDGSTTPWRNPKTGLESDGKTDTYDESVEAILGSPEVFFNAQFSAQGKKPIQSMTAGEVKRLIADMIGSSESAELAGKASEVVKALKPHQSAQVDEINRMKAQMPNEVSLRNSLASFEQGLQEAKQEQASVAGKIAELTGRIAAAAGSQEQLNAIRMQHQALDREFEELAGESNKARAELGQKLDSEAKSHEVRLHEARQRLQAATNLVNQLNAEVQRLKGLTAKEQSLQDARTELQDLNRQEAAQQAIIDEMEPKALQMDQVRRDVNDIVAKLTSAETDGKHLAQALAAAKETAMLLVEVPCNGTDLNGQCKLLAQARQASDKVPEMEVRLSSTRDAYRRHRQDEKALAQRLAELQGASAQVKTARDEMVKIGRRKSELMVLLNIEGEVLKAKELLPETRRKLQAAMVDLDESKAAEAAILEIVSAFAAERQSRLQALEAELAARKDRLEQMRKSLPPLQEGEDVQALQKALDEAHAHAKQLESKAVEYQQNIARTNAALEQMVKQQEQIERAEVRLKAIADEISMWVLLSKALGTDGIIAMTIDDAGPAIAQLANDLLKDCYGGRFSLELQTQRETQTGIAKEDFVIMVDDNHRGESKPIDLMSGGEKVWINECLVRAIALYMAQVADTRSQTLFSDEADGPLDPQRKRQFMQMKQAVLTRGGYEREYLVTHTPELVEMCDAVIRIEDL